MSFVRNLAHLLRVRQYYKNVLIFIAIFFSERLFDFSLYIPLLLGFVILCCASSINYIINDIIDIKNDRNHPEKLKKKPLASGELSLIFAIVLLIFLAGFIIISLVFLIPNFGFTLMIIFIIITGQLYNLVFKRYAFIDVIVLSLGYLWRALAGCFIIEEYISAWLFLAIFEIAMFLSIAKRKGDLILLGENNAKEHKNVYDKYNLKLIDQFYVITAASLFITYSLYLILKFNLFDPSSVSWWEYAAIFTIPIALYIIMRYMYLTSNKPDIARSTERAFLDKGIIIAGLILFSILLFSFYFGNIFT